MIKFEPILKVVFMRNDFVDKMRVDGVQLGYGSETPNANKATLLPARKVCDR